MIANMPSPSVVLCFTFLLVALAGLFFAVFHRSRAAQIYKKLFLAEHQKNDLAVSLFTSEERFYRLFSSMTEGVALHELIFDDAGKPRDYLVLMVNPAFEKQTGISAEKASGIAASKLYGMGSPPYLEEYSSVAMTGKPRTFETFFPPLAKHFSISVFSPEKNKFATVFEDITARKIIENEREATIRLLSLFNEKNNLYELMKSVTSFFHSWSGCEAIGIRLKNGDDYPYFETRGFPARFVELENYLCARDPQGQPLRDEIGDPIVECMCGNVIRGRFDAKKPFFTQKGSFWSNCTTKLLAATTEADRQSRTRNRCNQMGYESVALIRLKFGDKPLGLIQINDKRTDRFTLSFIEQVERFADSIAIALEQRRTQALLNDERERLLVTLRSIGDGVIATDVRGCIVLMNKVAESLTGWLVADAQGKQLNEVFTIVNEQTRQPIENPVQKVLKTGEIITLENHTILLRRGGGELVIADSGAPIRGGDNAVIGVVLVFRDDTEKQRSRDAMRKAERLESLGVLAGGIAHDFNNLLGGLFGYLELARGCIRDDREAADYLEKAFSVFGRAKDLTGQLLTFAKGGAPVRVRKALSPLINDAVQFALSGATVKPVFRIDPDLFPCDIDINQMAQVIDNIVINARDAMPRGGAIAVSAANLPPDAPPPPPLRAGKYVRISIADQGHGIAPIHLPHIFDPFFTTKRKGSGLGLAVSYSIISRHDGAIEVESELGKGTVFHIYLPASTNPQTIEPVKSEPSMHKGTGRILIMDDEEYIRDVASTMLKGMGYRIDCAIHGEEAIAMFSESLKKGEPYQLCILDLTIPGGMGGKEAKERLRALSRDIAIIASSGYSDDPVIASPTDHGFDASVRKPYNKAELAVVVAKVMEKK